MKLNDAERYESSRGAIRLEGLGKSFGDVTAVDGVDLDIKPGEFITLLGESGCGKTTTLLLIAGFHQPDTGRIHLDGEVVSGVPPHKRNLGMVFQNYALFPHMTVAQNIAYPLKRRGAARSDIEAKIDAALRLVDLDGYGDRYPRELSGGQQQRVAVARATVYGPPALLMDEPLSALDKKLRQSLQEEIRQMHRSLGTTIVYVTHDQDEAMALSDRIALMRAGRIEQIGTPEEVYSEPATLFAADFLGDANLLAGQVVGRNGDVADVRLANGAIVNAHVRPNAREGAVTVVIRPEKLRLEREVNGNHGVEVEVEDMMFLGRSIRCTGRFATGERWIMSLPAGEDAAMLERERRCVVAWDPQDASLVPRDPGAGETVPTTETAGVDA